MKIEQYNFDSDIELYNIGDLHRGDHNCNVDLFHKIILRIKHTDNAYWVSTGDLLQTAIRGGKFDSIHNSDTLEVEYNLLLAELGEISHKCLGIVSSNHPARVKNLIGLDIDKVLCRELNIPYLGDVGLINITCGKLAYYIVMHHGTGGGKKKGTKINSLEEMENIIPSADIYLTGHTHQYMTFQNELPYIDKKRNVLRYYEAHYVTTGHFLQWENSYAQKLRLRPAPQGAARLSLSSCMSGKSIAKNVNIELYSG